MSALALLHVIIEFTIESCVLYNTKSISYSDIRKCLGFVEIPAFRLKPKCHILFIHVCVSSIGFFGGLIRRDVIRHPLSRTDGNYLFLLHVYSLLLRISVFSYR